MKSINPPIPNAVYSAASTAKAADDVWRFLHPAELKSAELWSERFFCAKMEKLALTDG